VVWFGIINAIAILVALLLSFILQRFIGKLGNRQSVVWLMMRYSLLGLAILAFAMTRSFVWIVAAYVAIHTLREVGATIQSAWINRSIDSESRATVLSTISQMDAVGEAGGGPILGAIGVRLGLRASMLTAAAIMVPVLALLGRAWRFVSRSSESTES
jgi:hypothetical protein